MFDRVCAQARSRSKEVLEPTVCRSGSGAATLLSRHSVRLRAPFTE